MAAGDPGSPARYYSSTAVETALQSSIAAQSQGASNTSFIVASISGFPTSYPYTLIVDPDTSKEEVVTVTSGSSTTLTVTRGEDNTQAVAHSAGAVVRHGVSARDFRESENHIAARGYDIDQTILDAANQTHVHGIATGEGVVVGTLKAQTLENKTLTSPTISNPTITGTPGVGTSIVFEGSTTDNYETTLTAIDPTADRTIYLPNAGGNIVLDTATQTLTNKTIDMTGVTLTGLSSAGMVSSSATPKSYVDAILGSATAAATSAASAATSATSAATSATSAANSATASASSATASATSASAAATSATSAAASATAAATSASSAATSATSAQAWAIQLVTPVSGTDYSAKYNANLAATSASSAATSASSAATSASSAATSATASANSATASATSASAAATSATSAAASATAAATSATSAAASATAAATSAASAAASATAAAGYVVPSQTGNAGKFLGTDGSAVSWTNIVSANTSGNAFEIRQTGAGNALVVEDETNPDSSPFVITAGGNVGIGVTPSYKLDVSATARVGGSATNAGNSLLAYGQILNFTNINWNFGNIELVRNAANTATPRFLGMLLDGDSLTATTIGAYNSIWGIYDSAPTTGSLSSTLNAVMGYGAYAGHRWYTNGTERMRIDSSGNVGIGTQFISSRMNLAGNAANQSSSLGAQDIASLTINNNNGAALNVKSKILLGHTDSSTFAYSTVASYYASYNGANDIGTGLIFGTQLNAAGGTVERMRIDQSGNIGVGTTSPSTRFDIIGNSGTVTAPSYLNQTMVSFRNNFHTRIALVNGGAGTYSSEIASYTPGGAHPSYTFSMIPAGITFNVGNTAGSVTATERMRIGSDGLVGINAAAVGTQLFVNNSTAANVGLMVRGAASQTGDLLQVQNSAGTVFAEIDSAGNFGVGAAPTAKIHLGTGSTTAYGFISATPVVGLTAGNTVNMAYFADQRGTANDGLRIYNLRDTTAGSIGDWQTSSYRIQRNVDNVAVQGEIVFGASALTFAAQSGEVMRVTGTNVGIGTTSPTAKLDVNGPVKADNVVGANLLANGAFDIWQRGVGPFTSNTVYTTDRWFIYSSSGYSLAQETSVIPTGATNAVRITGTAANNFANLQQSLEQSEVEKLAGKTVTFSVYLRANATYNGSFNLQINWSTTGNSQTPTWTNLAQTNHTPSTSAYTRVSVTGTVPTNAKGLTFMIAQNVGLANGSVYYIALAKAEIGTLATEFVRLGGSLQSDLAACQRYYWRSTGGSTYSTYGAGYATLTTEAVFAIKCPTTMRIEPTSIDYANLGVDFYNVGNIAITALTLNSTGSGMDWVRVIATVASGLTQYRPYDISNANNAAGYIGFSAEL